MSSLMSCILGVPSSFLEENNNDNEKSDDDCLFPKLKNELMTGTSILSVPFKDGVVVGADSRSSTGIYVANRISDKLQQIGDFPIYMSRSGSSADTQNIGDYVSYYLKQVSAELGESPKVALAAKLCQQIIYSNKDHFSASVFINGWDKYKGGQVYEVPLGGTQVHQLSYAAGGSGSPYIMGYCDSMYEKHRDEILKNSENCKEFAIKALSLAIARDTNSGGLIRILVITGKGVQRETVMPHKK